MEHRWEARQAVDWETVIKAHDIGLIRGRAVNVSSQGIMLETGRIALARDSVVELTCVERGVSMGPIVRAPAQVVHFRGGRAGLIWVDRSPVRSVPLWPAGRAAERSQPQHRVWG